MVSILLWLLNVIVLSIVLWIPLCMILFGLAVIYEIIIWLGQFIYVYYIILITKKHRTMNNQATLAFYTARKRDGDVSNVADETGYSESHIRNILNGYRSINDSVADSLYRVSRRRMKNSNK